MEIDDGDGMASETLHVVGLDPSLRLMQRTVEFDTDDVRGALAELDRLHRQVDGN